MAAGTRAPETPLLCQGRQPRAPQLPGDTCRRLEGAERPRARTVPPLPGWQGCLLTASEKEDASWVQRPDTAWNAKLALCPREPALGIRLGLRNPSVLARASKEAGETRSHGKCGYPGPHVGIRGREDMVSLHAHSLRVINWVSLEPRGR